MTHPPRRYLDHPATSWPKPVPVIDAVIGALRDVGAAAGRGTHAAARAADAIRVQARRAAARVSGFPEERVALVPGATLGLNLAIHGLVEPGSHVLATAADHNATLRPLAALAEQGTIDLEIVPCDGAGRVDPDAVALAWRATTRMVVFSHASNVTGTLQDGAAIVALARGRGAVTIVDAAQSAGIVPPPPDADVVVAPGHKWLQGPQGIALVAVREGIEPRCLVQGGTGTESGSLAMPERFVDRFEAGTPDLGALAGLASAIAWREAHGSEAIAAHGRALAATSRAALDEIPGVRLLGAEGAGPPIVAFTVQGYDPAETAMLLEQVAGIEVRAGLHCAALVHHYLGTAPPGGAGCVRVGFGPFNTLDDARALIGVVAALLGVAVPPVVPLSRFTEEPAWQR